MMPNAAGMSGDTTLLLDSDKVRSGGKRVGWLGSFSEQKTCNISETRQDRTNVMTWWLIGSCIRCSRHCTGMVFLFVTF